MNRSILIAAVLMLISGLTHVVQIFIYEAHATLIGVVAFGLAYFIIGLFLLRGNRGAVWAGAVLPAIGGIGGVYRFFIIQPNPFSVFHVVVDLIVISICIYWLVTKRRSA